MPRIKSQTSDSPEEAFDGFYGVCTNLNDDASEIIKVNYKKWEIEECFRIMKNECKARPVYLSNDDRIEAHFITCFISLIIYRLLEERLRGFFYSIFDKTCVSPRMFRKDDYPVSSGDKITHPLSYP